MFVVGVPKIPLVLDRIAVIPASATSIRRINSKYIGPLMRVRRAADNAERDIYYTVFGALDTSDILAFAGTGGSVFVVTVYDQSGGTANTTQTTTANQPRIVNAGVLDTTSNLPAIYQTTGKDLAITLASTTNHSVVYTAEQTATGGARVLSGSTNWLLGWYNTGYTSAYFGSGFAITQSNTNRKRAVHSMTAASGTAVTVRRDGVALSITAVGSTFSTLSTNGKFSGTDEGTNNYFFELIVFQNTLTTSSLLYLEQSQGGAFSVTVV
jgi:hypothetical protein